MKDWRQWQIGNVRFNELPMSWRRIKPKIEKLYYRGHWDEQLFEKVIAVVGSRRVTRYGRRVVEMLVPGLVKVGYTIVSGFMYGVDTLAHKVCLETGGRTVAVLGSGLDELTPVENDKLYSRLLAENSLVVSEYEKNEQARLWTFPQRNRIVAGMSRGVLVVEGGLKSGSLITARLGFQQKKKVMAVPGNIDSGMSKGTNWLIRNGAVLVSSVEEILAELGEEKAEVKVKQMQLLSREERRVVDVLQREEMEVDELARAMMIDVPQLGRLLSELSLRGVVEEFNGKYMLGLDYVD